MYRHERIQNIFIQHGLASPPTSKTIPPTKPVDLAIVLHALNSAYQETGNPQYAQAANEAGRLIGFVRGAHGEFLAIEDNAKTAPEVQVRVDNFSGQLCETG